LRRVSDAMKGGWQSSPPPPSGQVRLWAMRARGTKQGWEKRPVPSGSQCGLGRLTRRAETEMALRMAGSGFAEWPDPAYR
ncbi:MAG: hypothetical protein HC880_02990, partial [Bacteroidia bacterium]|nr:hypothetical protein [Bacteroidia bacterium]